MAEARTMLQDSKLLGSPVSQIRTALIDSPATLSIANLDMLSIRAMKSENSKVCRISYGPQLGTAFSIGAIRSVAAAENRQILGSI